MIRTLLVRYHVSSADEWSHHEHQTRSPYRLRRQALSPARRPTPRSCEPQQHPSPILSREWTCSRVGRAIAHSRRRVPPRRFRLRRQLPPPQGQPPAVASPTSPSAHRIGCPTCEENRPCWLIVGRRSCRGAMLLPGAYV